MAGKKGRSGAHPITLKAHCAAVVWDVAVQKMDACLKHDSPKSPSWRWAFEQYAKLGGCYAPEQHEHSGTITVADVRAAQDRLTSRMDRLAERLGAAASPEFSLTDRTGGGGV